MDPLRHLDPPDIGLKSILRGEEPPSLPQQQTFNPVGGSPSRQLEKLWHSDSFATRVAAFTRPRLDHLDLLTPQEYETQLVSCIHRLEQFDASPQVDALHRALRKERELRELVSLNRKLLLQA